jgi:hypothetical protein
MTDAKDLARAITEAGGPRRKAIPDSAEELELLPLRDALAGLHAALITDGWTAPGKGLQEHQVKAAEARGAALSIQGTCTMVLILSVFTQLSARRQAKPSSGKTIDAVKAGVRHMHGVEVGEENVKRHLRTFLRFCARRDA